MAGKKKVEKEKPLDKMTVKELREIAKEMPEITGVHGKNKAELLATIKDVRGITDKPKKKKDSSVRGLKKKITHFKTQRQEAIQAGDKKMAGIFRRRITRLKKKTRHAT
ncbi:MAG: transcription termination factor Rho [Deltaproteobacteria bacterium]|nr:transcription termination factor Rho [Deltaproteobacteria bacterium]